MAIFSLFCLLVIYQAIKNADFTVPIPKVTDPLNEKESKCSEVSSLDPPNHLCATFALFIAAVLLSYWRR